MITRKKTLMIGLGVAITGVVVLVLTARKKTELQEHEEEIGEETKYYMNALSMSKNEAEKFITAVWRAIGTLEDEGNWNASAQEIMEMASKILEINFDMQTPDMQTAVEAFNKYVND